MNLTWAPGEGRPRAGPQALGGGAAHIHTRLQPAPGTTRGPHTSPRVHTPMYTRGLGHTRLRGDSPCPQAALADPVLQERGHCPPPPQPTHGLFQNLQGKEPLSPK